MRRSYFEQYRGAGRFGDFVWTAVYERGELEEGTPLWEDAYAVAREAMLRARENVAKIIAFLERQGYFFFGPIPNDDGRPGEPWLPPGPATSEQLQRLRALVGPLPLSLHAWWEIVGSVSLQGVFDDARGKGDDPRGWSLPMNDPLYVDPLEYALQQVEEQLADGADPSGPDGLLIDLAPDLYHKSHVSGGAPYAVRLPHGRIDTPLLNVRILLPVPQEAQRPYTEVGTSETFVEYLRRSFQWAGFPGFAFLPDPQMERLRPLFAKVLPI
ncbi:MAG: hypothetical protein M0Z94_11310 [Dehalococcoidales bacterium]|nr:hypothetical protein [Dehalococcoidales bacterium]